MTILHSLSSLKTGWAMLTNTASSSLAAAQQAAESFFAKSAEYKKQYARLDHKEWGYRHLEHKEMFMIREQNLPDELSLFSSIAADFHQLSLVCLAAICKELQLNPDILLNLVDSQAFSPGGFSSSVLRVIKYHDPSAANNFSDIHEDLGLLTFVSHTGVPALEIYDFAGHSGWLDVETMQGSNDTIVMAGESLSLVSNERYIPASHRVRSPGRQRLSINYHLRLKTNAILDSSLLTTPVTDTFSKPFCMTGGEFLEQEIQLRASVNGSY